MKKSDFYEITIKMLGLYLVVVVIGQLREVLMFASLLVQSKNDASFSEIDQMPIFLITVFCFIVLMVFSALMIFKTRDITKIICRKEDFEEVSGWINDKRAIYEVTLTVVGLLTIILTVPDFVFQLKSYIQSIQNSFQADNSQNFLISSGLKIVIGTLVIIYATAISSYLAKDRIDIKDRK